jgi:hypothetical protein
MERTEDLGEREKNYYAEAGNKLMSIFREGMPIEQLDRFFDTYKNLLSQQNYSRLCDMAGMLNLANNRVLGSISEFYKAT